MQLCVIYGRGISCSLLYIASCIHVFYLRDQEECAKLNRLCLLHHSRCTVSQLITCVGAQTAILSISFNLASSRPLARDKRNSYRGRHNGLKASGENVREVESLNDELRQLTWMSVTTLVFLILYEALYLPVKFTVRNRIFPDDLDDVRESLCGVAAM